MATMSALLCSILFTAICWPVGTSYRDLNKYQPLPEKRNQIINIATAELGVKEATGKNDGFRIEEYLRYTHLGTGHEWCAAFVSWCYAQAGLAAPRNPWSPALFPKARQIPEQEVGTADVFGIYGGQQKRIVHVGMVKNQSDQYIITIEGNSNNKVESRRRHRRTIYRYANWLNQ